MKSDADLSCIHCLQSESKVTQKSKNYNNSAEHQTDPLSDADQLETDSYIWETEIAYKRRAHLPEITVTELEAL